MIEIENLLEITKYLDGLRAVAFDLDDTLYGEKSYVRSGYRAVAKALPHIEGLEQKLWNAFERGASAIDDVLLSEGVYSEELKERCLRIYRTHFPEIRFYEGVVELLSSLRKDGYKIGIITDGRPEGQRAKIKALRLEEYVDNVIVTDELGDVSFRKPNRTAFVKMQEYFGVDFSQICYVGDNVKKDFIAPVELGMRAIWFKNKDGLYH